MAARTLSCRSRKSSSIAAFTALGKTRVVDTDANAQPLGYIVIGAQPFLSYQRAASRPTPDTPRNTVFWASLSPLQPVANRARHRCSVLRLLAVNEDRALIDDAPGVCGSELGSVIRLRKDWSTYASSRRMAIRVGIAAYDAPHGQAARVIRPAFVGVYQIPAFAIPVETRKPLRCGSPGRRDRIVSCLNPGAEIRQGLVRHHGAQRDEACFRATPPQATDGQLVLRATLRSSPTT